MFPRKGIAVQVSDTAAWAGRSQMRVALSLRFRDRLGAPIGIQFHQTDHGAAIHGNKVRGGREKKTPDLRNDRELPGYRANRTREWGDGGSPAGLR